MSILNDYKKKAKKKEPLDQYEKTALYIAVGIAVVVVIGLIIMHYLTSCPQ